MIPTTWTHCNVDIKILTKLSVSGQGGRGHDINASDTIDEERPMIGPPSVRPNLYKMRNVEGGGMVGGLPLSRHQLLASLQAQEGKGIFPNVFHPFFIGQLGLIYSVYVYT